MTTRTGPVTFGQLSVLRSLEVYRPADRAIANLLSVWPVPAGTSVPEVKEAWLRLVAAHDSLRTTYRAHGTGFQQEIHPYQPRRIGVTEIAADSIAAARSAAAQLMSTPLDVEVDQPWQAFVATVGGDAAFLVAVVHHVAADAHALGVLRTQFGRLLSGSEIEVAVQPLDLALAEQADTASAADTIDYWTGEWLRFLPEDRNDGDSSARRRASIHSVPAMSAATDLAARLHVSVQSVLLGVGTHALCRLTGRDRITYALMSANRQDERWSSLVSSINQAAPVTLAVEEEMRYDDYLRGVYIACLRAYQHGHYDVDALRDSLGRRGADDRNPTLFVKLFNFLGEGGEPAADSPVRSGVEWQPVSIRSGPHLSLVVSTGEGLQIGVVASEDYLPGHQPAIAAASIESILMAVAKSPSDRLIDATGEPHRVI
jgi:hypothetical protein